ncbi:MAG: hypothetical protein JSS36_11230 [Proteobacteria bacterium]|nr:hypothetical protein [Pseudomonadota bacterium]
MSERTTGWLFRGAAIYGFLGLPPLYLWPLPATGAEFQLGFIGLALVFQALFWMIGGDPRRWLALMPFAVAEKLVFGLPVMALAARHQANPQLVLGAAIDLLLGLLFAWAWWRGRTAN